MKLVFDNIIFALQKSGGISVVWYELISRILKSKNDLSFLNFSNNNIFADNIYINNKHIINNESNSYLSLKRYINPSINHIKEPFIFHSSYYRTCNNNYAINITTVHDFTYEFYEKGIKRLIHSWQKNKAIRNSDYIICISENTKKDLLYFLPDIDEKKIKIIYNGVSNDYFPKTDIIDLKIPFKKNEYILFVGARTEYKNFKLAVEAIAKTNLNLVIVGPPLNEVEIKFVTDTIKDNNKYYCTGRIDNHDLNDLYNCAYALLYPSVYEGFGIPVIEAQKAGCPVIAYNGSSIPEVIGNTPLLIEKLTTEDIISKIEYLKDNKEKELIIKNGLKNANRFTWDEMYRQVTELYNEAWLNKRN